MTPKLKVLRVVFGGTIRSWEIPAFRGAIIEKAGRENILFHNHIGQGFRYGYPLIQYKRSHSKPTLICLGDGIDEIHHFFLKRDWSIHISGRTLDMKIDHLALNQVPLEIGLNFRSYRLSNWVALNQRNYGEYRSLESLKDQLEFLERKLIGNILSFAKGVGWRIEEEVQVRIIEMEPSRAVKVKGITVQALISASKRT